MPGSARLGQGPVPHPVVIGGASAKAKLANGLAILAALALLACGERARAAEGGSSHYLPGVAGDIAIAQPPGPGLQVANTVWVQSGNVHKAVLQGQVEAGLDLDVVLDLVAGSYTFETPVLGGTYTIAALIPFGYAHLDAKATGPAGGTTNADGDSFDLSDMAFVPAQLNWSVGQFSFKLAEAIIAPTGGYSDHQAVNLGRNYWSFDTVGAATWFNTDIGTEVSVAPGFMVNTENEATNYRTGDEFHLDFTANQFLAETFAVGIRGYYYQQVTGDSGSGAILGSFRSESLGIGPGFFWTPKFAGGKLVVQGKWLHDLEADKRFKSDYGTLAIAWKF
jgi:hypothetical protein